MAQKKQETALTGLSDKEVLISREKYGNNLLTPPKRPSMWKLYLEKFRDPVIRILLVAAFFSLVIAIIENEYAETIGIFFAIFLATGIGFYFEYDANKKFDLLNAVGEETPVTVIRNGKVREIPRKEIVVGDIVVLNTGEEIPADGILLEAISLQVNESNLTGELMVNKTIHEELFDEEATYPSNEVMRGTTVVDGHGIMKVERVGDSTEIGKVARQATEQSEEETPLNIQLTKLAGFIGKIGFTIATLTFIVFTAKDLYSYLSVNEITDWHGWIAIARIVLKYFMMAVTLIVVAVPEGLPMSVTLSLALNMRRMLKTNNLVRKMHACETMGAITVICTDKTGTLTTGCFDVTDIQAHRISESELLTLLLSVEQKSTHPIAQAIVRYAKKQNISAASVSEMHELAGHGVEAVIGGQEVLVGNIRLMKERGISIPEELSDQVATVVICAIDKKYAGHLLLSDTLKDDAVEAIAKLRKLGVTDIRLLSGDKKEIVKSFARRLGIDQAYGNLLPEDKAAHIWEMVEEPGKSVAFVGDGMNDAPVLALSHVGIAMGGLGSDAAIESADVVIQNDQPSKVATAITIGRKTRTIVRQNIIGALVVKGIVLSAGALGYATLWGAVFADVGVALLAVLNSVRILNRKVW